MRVMDPERLKLLFAGVAASAALGLLLGDLMTPDFVALAEAQAAEPLPEIPVPRQARAVGKELAAEWTSWTGDIPDYVIGTDWTQPGAAALAADSEAEQPPPPSPPEEPTAQAPAPPPAPAAAAPVRTAEAEPHPAPAYPSMGGGVLAGLEPQAHAQPQLH